MLDKRELIVLSALQWAFILRVETESFVNDYINIILEY
jgi:hypothetical protein